MRGNEGYATAYSPVIPLVCLQARDPLWSTRGEGDRSEGKGNGRRKEEEVKRKKGGDRGERKKSAFYRDQPDRIIPFSLRISISHYVSRVGIASMPSSKLPRPSAAGFSALIASTRHPLPRSVATRPPSGDEGGLFRQGLVSTPRTA